MCAICEETLRLDDEKKRNAAADKVGHLADGMWATTDGQRFHSMRMAINVQMEIDEGEL